MTESEFELYQLIVILLFGIVWLSPIWIDLIEAKIRGRSK